MKNETEISMLDTAEKFYNMGYNYIAGIDEVGRGPLAGPVVAACIVMPQEPLVPYVNDSKKLSEKRRESVAAALKETALACSLAWVGPEVIDEINILEATKRAFTEAYDTIFAATAIISKNGSFRAVKTFWSSLIIKPSAIWKSRVKTEPKSAIFALLHSIIPLN